MMLLDKKQPAGPLLPLCIKFDPRRSPLELLPEDLRPRLLEIFQQHALAALQRNGHVWEAWEPPLKARA
jgi:hypothetical protein